MGGPTVPGWHSASGLLGEDEALAVRTEREARRGALVPDPDRDASVPGLEAAHADRPAARGEEDAAAAVDAELARVESAREVATAVRKAKDEAARPLPVRPADDRAEHGLTVVRELDLGVLNERIEERRCERRVLGIQLQPVAVGPGIVRAEHEVRHAQCQGVRAAGRVL